ncbi:MAG: hypothetical protein ACRDYB_07145 [Acidimicrobiales bacterium]
MAGRLEARLAATTGRPRELSVRALLVALMVLALDDRPLHLWGATKLVFCQLSAANRALLGVGGEATTTRSLLAAYRRVRYLFHRILSVVDPSGEPKNRRLSPKRYEELRQQIESDERARRQAALEELVADLVAASVKVAAPEELAGVSGSVGLDATPVPLFSRGPSQRTGCSAADPDGGWYVREGDHREHPGPNGKPVKKVAWALEATIATLGRGPDTGVHHPNLVVGVVRGRPGVDPAGTGVRVLRRVRAQGFSAGVLGADRGYTQGLPTRFHLPVRALGYSLVMDYKEDDLGRQATSHGAVMVDGAFYCPAMPEALVTAAADRRAGRIDEASFSQRIAARVAWRLVRKEGPDADGYERHSCPAQGDHPHLACSLRPAVADKAVGRVPVLHPPATPPTVCTQTAVTIAPDVGARFRQDLAYGSGEWAATYASYRNTIEGTNGYLKDTAHEALAAPGRRRVRGIAAQSLFVAFLVMAANVRKIAAYRQLVADGAQERVAARARRRRVSLADFRAPP